MKIRATLASLLLSAAAASPTSAGLEMGLKLECASILRFERLDATLTVVNTGRTPLMIMPGTDQNNGVVRFLIEKKRFEPLPKTDKAPLIRKLIVGPDKTESVTLDLSLWYAMAKEGRYIVRAEIDMLGATYKSNAVMVDVVRGLEILNLTRGVPGMSGRTRTYSLRYWSRNRQEHLFLCIEDEAAGVHYGVFRLGTVIRLKKPVLKVDSLGYITVRHQSGPERFTRSGFLSARAGVKYIGQVHELEDGRPYPAATPPPGLELTPAPADEKR